MLERRIGERQGLVCARLCTVESARPTHFVSSGILSAPVLRAGPQEEAVPIVRRLRRTLSRLWTSMDEFGPWGWLVASAGGVGLCLAGWPVVILGISLHGCGAHRDSPWDRHGQGAP